MALIRESHSAASSGAFFSKEMEIDTQKDDDDSDYGSIDCDLNAKKQPSAAYFLSTGRTKQAQKKAVKFRINPDFMAL